MASKRPLLSASRAFLRGHLAQPQGFPASLSSPPSPTASHPFFQVLPKSLSPSKSQISHFSTAKIFTEMALSSSQANRSVHYIPMLQERCISVHSFRPFSTYSGEPLDIISAEELRRVIDDLNEKFAEAREEIESASESKETVYFNEEATVARECVEFVLKKYRDTLSRLGETEKGALQRSMGMKMEQLKAELEQLNE